MTDRSVPALDDFNQEATQEVETKGSPNEDVLHSGYERKSTRLQSEKRHDRQISEPSEGAQGDLFTPTGVPKDTAKKQAQDNFNILYTQRESERLNVGTDVINTPQEAAHVLAPYRKHAQETFLVLVTDENNKIVNVIRHSKGLKASSSVSPIEVVGAIAST